MERHCPLQIEIGDGQKITRNPFPDNPEHLRRQPPPSPPSLLPFTPNVAVPPTLPPYQRSRNNKPPFCLCGPSETGGDNRREGATPPTDCSRSEEPPREGKSGEIPSVLSREESEKASAEKKNKTDKTSVEGKPSRR